MKVKLSVLLLVVSALLVNCGKNNIEKIVLKDAIFSAEGYNPEWKLKIDSNNGIHFYSNSALDKIVTVNSDVHTMMGISATSYNAKTDSAQIKVEIFRKQCINSKTDTETKYEVRVIAKRNEDNNYTKLKGCGSYLLEE